MNVQGSLSKIGCPTGDIGAEIYFVRRNELRLGRKGKKASNAKNHFERCGTHSWLVTYHTKISPA